MNVELRGGRSFSGGQESCAYRAMVQPMQPFVKRATCSYFRLAARHPEGAERTTVPAVCHHELRRPGVSLGEHTGMVVGARTLRAGGRQGSSVVGH